MRTDQARVLSLARDFATSDRAKLWHFVTDDVRHALIDAAIMDCIRLADAVDNQTPLTPIAILDFRNALIATLRTGLQSRTGRRRFTFGDDVHPGFADPAGETPPESP